MRLGADFDTRVSLKETEFEMAESRRPAEIWTSGAALFTLLV
jgi:hypothetical protein